jgi:DNA primase/replicative DNA helicase
MTSSTPSRLVQTDKLKAEIAEALPIAAVAERLCDVDLARAGRQLKGLCPIHGEGTPSFYVDEGKGLWHCFGCKTGGDAITLVREVHHVGYHEALQLMAAEAGVDIAKYERPFTDEEKALEGLREWCEGWVTSLAPDASRMALPVAQRYGVGVVGPKDVPKEPPRWFQDTGDGDRMYLFRQGGTVFPYRTSYGKLVGWKIRLPDKSMYLVPNGFPLLEPVVYGLDQARPHIEQGRVVAVEGEYDKAALDEHGMADVVALGGGRWSDDQMDILVDHKIREVVFLLDGDEGGRTAAESIAKRYWNDQRIRVEIQLCPSGSDPEDLVRAFGIASIEAQLSMARSALEWLLWEEWIAKPRETLGQKMDYVAWVRSEYGEHLSGLEESLVLREVARWLEVPEADVLDFARAEQTLLQVPESEKVVIGKAVRDGDYFRVTRKRIAYDDFHVIKHRRLWQELEQFMADGLDWDVVAITRRAEQAGVSPEYVEMLAEMGDLNIGWHEDQVTQFSVRRGARADADRFRELIADLSVEPNQLIGGLTHAVTSRALQRGSDAFRAIADQVDDAMEKLHHRMKNPNDVVGISLGSQFPLFTRNLQGLQPRRLVLVAATSGGGKSTLTLQWSAVCAIQNQVPTDFISLEMDYDEIIFKLASHLTGIDSMKISGGALDGGELERVEKAMARIRMSPLRVYAPDGMTTNEFVLYAREAKMERRTEVFVVDYAQMVAPDPEEYKARRDQQLGRFAYAAKLKVARGLDSTVIAVAQLRRDAAGKDEPTPEDMGDSYDLSRAADVIVLLSKPEDQTMTDGWIGKNRQGPGQVRIPFNFDKPNQTFSEGGGVKVPDYRILS